MFDRRPEDDDDDGAGFTYKKREPSILVRTSLCSGAFFAYISNGRSMVMEMRVGCAFTAPNRGEAARRRECGKTGAGIPFPETVLMALADDSSSAPLKGA